MTNPEKPAYIPDRPKGWKPKEAPEFIRDVMGSSAGLYLKFKHNSLFLD